MLAAQGRMFTPLPASPPHVPVSPPSGPAALQRWHGELREATAAADQSGKVEAGLASAGGQCSKTALIRTALAAYGTAAAAAPRMRNRRQSWKQRERENFQWSHDVGAHKDRVAMKFAGIKVTNQLAEWLQRQEAVAGRKVRPTPIQAMAIPSIYEGQAAWLEAPTGTGKSLAFLLPMLQRLQAQWDMQPMTVRSNRRELQMLVLVPSANLQIQLCALIRSIVGPTMAKRVIMLRRDVDNTVPSASVVVATANQMVELLEAPDSHFAWRRALAGLKFVVLDEADKMITPDTTIERRERNKKARVKEQLERDEDGPSEQSESCARIVRAIASFKQQKLGRMLSHASDWQLVAASATVTRQSVRSLSHWSGLKAQRITADRRAPKEVVEGMGLVKHAEESVTWAQGTRHSAVHHSFVPMPAKECSTRKVVETLQNMILSRGWHRTMVIISNVDGEVLFGKSRNGESAAKLLEEGLEMHGVMVVNCSIAVQRVAESILLPRSTGSDWQSNGHAASTGQEVIVGGAAEIRGVDIPDVDAVILVGKPKTTAEYIHCSGRTGRLRMGRSIEETTGEVVSIINEADLDAMSNMAKMAGFIAGVLEKEEQPLRKAMDVPDMDEFFMQEAMRLGLDVHEGLAVKDEMEAVMREATAKRPPAAEQEELSEDSHRRPSQVAASDSEDEDTRRSASVSINDAAAPQEAPPPSALSGKSDNLDDLDDDDLLEEDSAAADLGAWAA